MNIKRRNGMKVVVEEGMEFISKDRTSQFVAKKWDYYGDNEPIWCAFTEKFIYPISELVLSSYLPKVNGKWVNEPNELIFD